MITKNETNKDEQTPSSEDIEKCIELLKFFSEDSLRMSALSKETRILLLKSAGQLSRPAKTEVLLRNKKINKIKKQIQISENKNLRATTGIRKARLNSVFEMPEQVLLSASQNTEQITTDTLNTPQECYVCKKQFVEIHHFYDSMCPTCAEFNYKKRFQSAPLHGQVALITGSRLKIGYHSTLMMLRAGAKVIATTRFPKDSALRFSKEKDFSEWSDRLQIYGLDLRHTPSVEIFCRYLQENLSRLDILINNAAQTVRRPPGFYSHLLETEFKPVKEFSHEIQKLLSGDSKCKAMLTDWSRLKNSQSNLESSSQLNLESNLEAKDNKHKSSSIPGSGYPLDTQWWGNQDGPGIGLRASAELSQIPYSIDNALNNSEVFPQGQLDADLQQVDLRTMNSWRMKLADVSTPEMLEVQLVNAIAPFVLCSRLSPIMRRDFTGKKHIVNVTAMEGKFHKFHKEDRHPHTNMAKAALNMLTLTSASDLAKSGIFMNAVDTGWVTDEDPAHLALSKQQIHDFQPPLDIVDGAARVCDPFFDGINTGEHWCGKFLKDYFPTSW